MKRAQGFCLGFGTALGAVAVLNSRVLLFAAQWHRMPVELRDGSRAAEQVNLAIEEWKRETNA